MLKKHRELIASRSVDDSAIRIIGISDNEVVMVGYILYRNNRHSHGGGVLIAFSNILHSSFTVLYLNSEALLIKLYTNPIIYVCCVISLLVVPVSMCLMYLSPFVLFLLNIISSYWGILISRIYLGNGLLAPHSPLVSFVIILSISVLSSLWLFLLIPKGAF